MFGLIKGNNESAYRQEVSHLAVWCAKNNLELNSKKTVEMLIDFRRAPSPLLPLTINSSVAVKVVESFKFLGTTIANNLKWEENTLIIKRAHIGMFFLRQLH